MERQMARDDVERLVKSTANDNGRSRNARGGDGRPIRQTRMNGELPIAISAIRAALTHGSQASFHF
jgi:hypothetical protein